MEENPYAPPIATANPPLLTSQPGTSPYGAYREVGGLKIAILIFLGIGVSISAYQIFLVTALNEIYANPDTPDATLQAETELLSSSQQLSYIDIGIFVITVILWCFWKNLSCKNAWLFQATGNQNGRHPMMSGETFTPGWAVGYYFVPILLLWKPFQAMAFIRNQMAEVLNIGPLLGLWWTAWLSMRISSVYFTRNSDSITTIEGIISYNQGIAILSGITIVASVLAAAVIFTLSAAQLKLAGQRNLRFTG